MASDVDEEFVLVKDFDPSHQNPSVEISPGHVIVAVNDESVEVLNSQQFDHHVSIFNVVGVHV